MVKTRVFEFGTFLQYDLGRVVHIDCTAGTLKKRPICSEKQVL